VTAVTVCMDGRELCGAGCFSRVYASAALHVRAAAATQRDSRLTACTARTLRPLVPAWRLLGQRPMVSARLVASVLCGARLARSAVVVVEATTALRVGQVLTKGWCWAAPENQCHSEREVVNPPVR
jgi:hypothetical protein